MAGINIDHSTHEMNEHNKAQDSSDNLPRYPPDITTAQMLSNGGQGDNYERSKEFKNLHRIRNDIMATQ